MLRARCTDPIEWRAALWAGLVYTLGVFVFAFVIGAIRVTMVAPRLGDLLAVIFEAPIVLAVSWRVSSWCTERYNVNRNSRSRTLMGAAAFSILILLELSLSLLVFGETVDHYFAKYATTPGIFGLGMQFCFAALPWIQGHLRAGASPRAQYPKCIAPHVGRCNTHAGQIIDAHSIVAARTSSPSIYCNATSMIC
jgi:hypothetical protein